MGKETQIATIKVALSMLYDKKTEIEERIKEKEEELRKLICDKNI